MSTAPRFIGALCGVVVLASCTSAGGLASPTRPGSSLSPLPSPSAAESAGPRTCVSSSEGQEFLCSLDAGTYTTEFFRPGLTYTMPSTGWASLNREASPGNFHLFPPGATLAGFSGGESDAISVISAVVPPGTCTGQPSGDFKPSFVGLTKFLMNNDHLRVTHVRNVTVGDWDGTAMDIAFARSDGCSDGVYADVMVGVDPSHGAFGVSADQRGARLYLLHDPDRDTALAIQVDDAAGGSDYGDGEDWLGVAESVIKTFTFAP
jgi:hypothetical protein